MSGQMDLFSATLPTAAPDPRKTRTPQHQGALFAPDFAAMVVPAAERRRRAKEQPAADPMGTETLTW
ncbi:hypothetical protein ACQSSU_20265 [Micromonospora echinospora]